ncbi:MAG: ParA family protein [Candidatus Hydrogenedentes bacterium]|nr:ParA family protein [Candidatus Hydrogenedentota bacterium]
MGRVLAIANQKGGVGKTTTAVNLSAALALAGQKVLLIDLDPQGNATSGLGINKNQIAHTLYDVLTEEISLNEAVQGTAVADLFVVPSNRQLVGAEVEFVSIEQREYRLKRVLDSAAVNYNFVIIDCPPSLSLLTVNGLVAANGVLVTLQCEYYALEGLSELLQTIKLVRDNLNNGLRVEGVLLTMYAHTNLSKQVVDDVREHLGPKVFTTVIPRNVTLSEAPSFGKPAVLYDGKSAGALAYEALAKEVIARV